MSKESPKAESNVKSTAEVATELIKAIPVYQDAIQPAAKEIGKSITTVAKTVAIALAPLKALVWGYEKIEELIATKVTEKLKNTPEENITTPDAQIAGPAIMALQFCGNHENLRELFANLLATAMDKETLHKAHPSYVDIIKNLTPDEATLLTAFLENTSHPLIDIRLYENEAGTSYKLVAENLCKFEEHLELSRSDLTQVYLNNLCRLGILEIPTGIVLSNLSLYLELENDETLEGIKKFASEKSRKLSFTRKTIKLTSFGKQFVENIVKAKE